MIETKVAVSEIGNRVVLLVDGEVRETTLEDNEILVDLADYNNYIKPRWNGSGWVEGATEEEIAEYKAEKNQPQLPTLEKRLSALEILELERMFGI